MSTSEFDLDINNYSVKDLAKFFKLNTKKQYSADDIETIEYTIREQLLTSGHVDKRVKADLIEFLKKAKELLIQVKCPLAKTPSIVPDNFRLDNNPNYPRSKESISREHELIDRPIQPFVYTKNSDFFPGTLNPLEKRILTKNVSIDTTFRSNYFTTVSSDFTYVFPEQMNNITSIKLTSMELPHMWFQYSSKDFSNQMTIKLYNLPDIITDDNGTPIQNATHIIQIPSGNYDSVTFLLSINNLFSNTGQGLELIKVDINTNTSQTIFRTFNTTQDGLSASSVYAIGSPYYSAEFYFDIDLFIPGQPQVPLYKTMGWMLGFRQSCYRVNNLNTYYNPISTSRGAIIFEGYLTSESSFGSNSMNYVFLEVDDFQNNFPTNTVISTNSSNATYLGKNILARITLTSNNFTYVLDTAQDQIFKKREYFGPVKLEKLKIRLLDRHGDVIDMIQNDFSFLLELTQLYQ